MSVYILELRCGRYYVGLTNDVDQRIQAHFDGNGAHWTRLYKPISCVEVVENCDLADELAFTLRYMCKYGVSNVRGSMFCAVSLSADDMIIIRRLIDGIEDHCYICNSVEHYAENCPQHHGKRRKKFSKRKYRKN